jgi:hypothetical protein
LEGEESLEAACNGTADPIKEHSCARICPKSKADNGNTGHDCTRPYDDGACIWFWQLITSLILRINCHGSVLKGNPQKGKKKGATRVGHAFDHISYSDFDQVTGQSQSTS